jgi:hypothetical protein
MHEPQTKLHKSAAASCPGSAHHRKMPLRTQQQQNGGHAVEAAEVLSSLNCRNAQPQLLPCSKCTAVKYSQSLFCWCCWRSLTVDCAGLQRQVLLIPKNVLCLWPAAARVAALVLLTAFLQQKSC